MAEAQDGLRDSRRYRVQSVQRALAILDLLADAGAGGRTLSELARGVGVSKSAMLALLRTLVEQDFVANTDAAAGHRYRLGLALARLGERALAQTGLLEVAMPVLGQLTEATGQTSRLGVLDDGHVVVVARVDGSGFIHIQSHVGRRELPHCSALGKAILSHLPEAHVLEIASRLGLPRRTPNTITDIESLLEELRLARERGYAIDNEEDSLGVVCVGAPILDHRGGCVAAISVTDVKLGSATATFDLTAEAVTAHARALSVRMGASADLLPGTPER
ncbi:MAG TPA: IclR family transcriptional regulator [Gaiellaceae bacterium]